MEMDIPLQILILIVGFPMTFVILWCCICYLLSITSGWRRLAESYANLHEPKIPGILRSGAIGSANYQRCLRVESTKEGLRLQVCVLFRIGHPHLLIPWRDIHFARPEDYQLDDNMVLLEIGTPVLATISFKRSLVKELALKNRLK